MLYTSNCSLQCHKDWFYFVIFLRRHIFAMFIPSYQLVFCEIYLNPLLRHVLKWSDILKKILQNLANAARFLKCVRPFYNIAK